MRKEGGYTVVEAGLAIALSASLVLLTFGLATMAGQQRFRTSLTTAQSFIQQQYNEVRSGINSRLGGNVGNLLGCSNSGSTSAAATSDDCYTIGRLLTFNSTASGGQITSSYIVARTNTGAVWPKSDKSALANLQSSDVKLFALTSDRSDAGLSPTSKLIGNGSDIVHTWMISGDHASTNGNSNFAIFRSPLDGSLVTVANMDLRDASGDGVSDATVRRLAWGANTNANLAADSKIAIGITNGNLGFRGGLICIAGGDASAGISNNYNASLDWGKLDDDGINSANVVRECSNWE